MSLIKYVNSLKALKRFRAVSFEMHCDIGHILDSDDDSIEATEVRERVLLDSDNINFIP